MASPTAWCLLAVTALLIAASEARERCGHKPADIVFLLDSSASIPREDFSRQLRFVAEVVSVFDISAVDTRVGVVSFSNWAFLEFHLNAHARRDDVISAVTSIRQIRGDTNTAAGLQFARTTMLQAEHGARDDVPHIVIVMTDGRSNQPRLTKLEAARLHARGIHVFAIGIGGRVDRYELRAIGSSPEETYIFRVPSYKALQSIQDLLVIKTCEVTNQRSTAPPTTTEKMVVDQACGEAASADIVFATSPSASVRSTRKAVAFYRKLARGLDIGPDRVRVALVPKECDTVVAVDLKHFEEKAAVLEGLNAMQIQQRTTAGVLRYMRGEGFAEENGGRPIAKRIGVIIIDEADPDAAAELDEATKARLVNGVELFVVGVGKRLSPERLRRLATEPAEQHVFHVADYDDLASIVGRVSTAICPVSRL